jgi:hypothetical protein
VRDALSPEGLNALYEDPHQALHIAFPRDLRDARDRWRTWKSQGIIAPEPLPALYAYSQTFHVAGQERGPFTRVGIIGCLPVELPVIPHEKTLPDREAGIAEALGVLRVQATPVHLLAEAEWEAVREVLQNVLLCPRVSVAGWEGVMHRVVPIQHAGLIGRLREAFAGAKYYIADGHHRWRAVQQAGLSHLLVFVTDKADPTLWVPSAHRLLWSVADVLAVCEQYFDVRRAGARLPLWQEVMGLRHAVGLVGPSGEAWTLRLRPAYWGLLEERPLISWLHGWVIDPLVEEGGRLAFGREWGLLMQQARSQGAWLFAMPPLRLGEIFRAAERGEPLPPKATYFFPKVLSGLVFYEAEER